MNDLTKSFKSAVDLFEKLESFSSESSPDFQSSALLAIQQFEDCTNLVNEISLFSINEEVDELPTSSLRYFLLPYYLGELTLKITSSIEERATNIEKSCVYFTDFLHRIKDYDIVDVKVPNITSDSSHEQHVISDILSREQKIAKYREQKQLEEELRVLKKMCSNENISEDVQREYILQLIKKCAFNAENSLRLSIEELTLLKNLPKNPTKSNSREPSRRNPQQPPVFILTKDSMQKRVFGAGYPSLPSMTVEEWCEDQIKKGFLPKPSSNSSAVDPEQQANQESFQKRLNDERLQEIDDPEFLRKARDWDEFKDDTRKGSGNTFGKG